MTKPIQIRKEDVVRDIRELAALTQQPITEVVASAVRTELERERRRGAANEQHKTIHRIVADYAALPKTGRMLGDDDLYDVNGLPK
jgi:hypothetical protein